MKATVSKHIRFLTEGDIEIDMLNGDLDSVQGTVQWAFPDSKIIKGSRGQWIVDLNNQGDLYALVVDLYDLVILLEVIE